jgi:hypothetical protein
MAAKGMQNKAPAKMISTKNENIVLPLPINNQYGMLPPYLANFLKVLLAHKRQLYYSSTMRFYISVNSSNQFVRARYNCPSDRTNPRFCDRSEESFASNTPGNRSFGELIAKPSSKTNYQE